MLNNKQKKYLQTLSHNRKAIIWIGQKGLTEEVIREIDFALLHHELVKVRIRAGDRSRRNETAETVCRETGADLVHKIGNVVTLYRPNPDKRVINLPG